MGEHVIKMPDVGEGVAEAELVEWHVKPGDLVREDALIAAVMTDKATVEIPSPVEGEILWLGAEIGDMVAVGSPFVRLKVAGAGNVATELASPQAEAAEVKPAETPVDATQNGEGEGALVAATPRREGEKPLASPAVRRRAMEAGLDLAQVPGSGPSGRISREDLEAYLARGGEQFRPSGMAQNDAVEEIRIIGLRKKIAERMALSASRIPHITYVEEVDVTALEDLRAALNKERRAERPKLTLLPFLMRAMVRAIAEQPQINGLFDDEAGILRQHGGVHIGIATQTEAGLMVPVVRHAEARDIWDCAGEVSRLAEAAKAGRATRDELGGSTITISSLGNMGGIASTPLINYPEVAIIGVNKIMMRPLWDGTQFIPRKMMNLSSSFDHRVIDGWDAATFIQRIKTLLETPALIFIER